MNETEDSGSSPNLWQAFRRRRKAMLWTAIAVLALATVAALVWPARYSASGVILIEQQELPAELVRSTVSSYASQRIQVISQRVMTTENLMGIIQRYGLYADMRKRSPREEVIKQMRADTALQMISADVIDPRDGHPTKATIAFSVSYRSPSAELAAKVANELVSLYLQQNVETRERSSRDAAVFLTGESARLDKDIKEQQARIAAFKEKHANELPELTQLNLQKTTRIEEEIRDADSQLRSLAQQLTFLDAQLAQISPTAQIYASTGERVQSPADRLKFVRTEYARALAMYSPDHPDVQRLKREMDGLEAATAGDATLGAGAANDDRRQLESARTQLESALKRYSPDHPDVIRAQRLVDSLQARVSADDAQGGGGAVAALSADPTLDRPANTAADNPPYIQIQAQRQATANEIRSLQQKRQELEASLGGIERDLARTPGVERDYTAMLRDLESAQLQYRQVRQKQMEAETAQDLEVERKGERFTLIEPPYTPEEPTSPNRPLILLFGLMLAISAAFAAAALLESTDGSVRGRHDLRALLTAPPLAVIPVMHTVVDRARMRQRRTRAIFGSVASVVLLLIVIHVLYRPLDVLWSVALRHLGI